MAQNLFQLNCYFENSFYEKIVIEMLEKIVPNIDYPSAFSNWLNVFFNYTEQNIQLAIMGEKATEFAQTINATYSPNLIIAGNNSASNLPFLKSRFEPRETMFYYCKNKTCELPTKNFQTILNTIKL